jgi:tetratricopeptide (TPR) repeat protein
MKSFQRLTFPLWLISVFLLPAIVFGAQTLTWEEHREAAEAQLRYQLADPVSAAQHLERALTLAREQQVEPAVLGDLMDRLADAYNLEDNGESKHGITRQEATLVDALRFKEKALGESAPELVPTLKQLSTIRLVQQRKREGFELIARALTIQGRRYGVDSAEVADLYTYLGNSYTMVGDREQAEKFLRKGVEILRRLPDPPAEIYSGAFASLAGFLHDTGRNDEAAALDAEYAPVASKLGAKADEEAKGYEHLPRVPASSDVAVPRPAEPSAKPPSL